MFFIIRPKQLLIFFMQIEFKLHISCLTTKNLTNEQTKTHNWSQIFVCMCVYCLHLFFSPWHQILTTQLHNIYFSNMYRMFPIFFKTTASLLLERNIDFFFKLKKKGHPSWLDNQNKLWIRFPCNGYVWLIKHLCSRIFWNSHLSNPVVCCCGRSRTPNGSKTSGRPNHHYFYKEWKIGITFHEVYIFWSLWDIRFWGFFFLSHN